MSRRYATLASLMTGRGGVHEVNASRLVPIPVDALEGIQHVVRDPDETHDDDKGDDNDDVGIVGVDAFASHVEYQLPTPRGGGGDETAEADTPSHLRRSLHVLRLAPRWARRLQREILPRARENAKRGYEALERLVAGKEGGVVVSNVGGYQSSHDLLEPAVWSDSSDEEEDVEDVEGDGKKKPAASSSGPGEENVGDDDDARGRPSIKGWGMLSSVVCAAHERVRDSARGERPITREDLYGWLNGNGAGDYNKLHDHGGAESWSGVYYVQCPDPVEQPTSDSDDSESDEDLDGESFGLGALGLRCHEPTAPAPAAPAAAIAVHKEGDAAAPVAASSASASASTSAVPYLRFRPTAGDLVLFRGDVLHAVESNGWAKGGGHVGEAADMDMERVRLSLAFNEDSLANDKKKMHSFDDAGKESGGGCPGGGGGGGGGGVVKQV